MSDNFFNFLSPHYRLIDEYLLPLLILILEEEDLSEESFRSRLLVLQQEVKKDLDLDDKAGSLKNYNWKKMLNSLSRVISLVNEDEKLINEHPAWMMELLSGWEHNWARQFKLDQSEVKYVLAWNLEEIRLELIGEPVEQELSVRSKNHRFIEAVVARLKYLKTLKYNELESEFNAQVKPKDQNFITLMSHQDPSLVFQDRFGQWHIKENPIGSLLTETIWQRIKSGRSLYQSPDVPQELARWVDFLEVSGYLDHTIDVKSLPYRHWPILYRKGKNQSPILVAIWQENLKPLLLELAHYRKISGAKGDLLPMLLEIEQSSRQWQVVKNIKYRNSFKEFNSYPRELLPIKRESNYSNFDYWAP